MSTDKRFDETIMETAEQLVKELLKHKELQSVAVILNWDMPPAAGLPVGVYMTQAGHDSITASVNMQSQLPRLTLHLCSYIDKALQKLQAERNSKENKPAVDSEVQRT